MEFLRECSICNRGHNNLKDTKCCKCIYDKFSDRIKSAQKKCYQANPSKMVKRSVEWGKLNKEQKYINNKKWRDANKEVLNLKKREYRQKNKALIVSKVTFRKKNIKQATPIWLTALHKQQINQLYVQANSLVADTGIKHHVDHIIPIKGKTVCGLHVPWNLRIITAKENMSKHNSLIEELAC